MPVNTEYMETAWALRDNPRMSRAEKIKKLRLRSGLVMRELADGMDYKHPSGWQAFENSQMDYVIPDDLELLLKIFVGKGNPPITPEEVLELGGPMIAHYWDYIQAINRLSPRDADRALAYAQGLGDQDGTKSRR